jgi:hypothetical protein
VKFFVLFALNIYKRWLSPMFLPACRYVPSCSEYAQEAVERYGVLRGGWKAAWRLLRCHPFARGGFDPVERPCPAPHHNLRLSTTNGRKF